MKKNYKFLIGALCVPTTIAAITPFISSCGKGGNSFSTDGSKFYIPKYKSAVADTKNYPNGYTLEEATKLYFEALDKDPNLFIDDLMCGVINFIHACSKPVTKPNGKTTALKGNFNISYSDVSINKDKQTISYSGNITCDSWAYCLFETDKTRTGIEHFKFNNLEFKFENVKYTAAYNRRPFNTRLSLWSIEPIISSQDEIAREFKIFLKLNGSILHLQKEYEFNNETYELNRYNYNHRSIGIEQFWKAFKLFYSNFGSNYLINLQPNIEENQYENN